MCEVNAVGVEVNIKKGVRKTHQFFSFSEDNLEQVIHFKHLVPTIQRKAESEMMLSVV